VATAARLEIAIDDVAGLDRVEQRHARALEHAADEFAERATPLLGACGDRPMMTSTRDPADAARPRSS
jgi:hypothetical protein